MFQTKKQRCCSSQARTMHSRRKLDPGCREGPGGWGCDGWLNHSAALLQLFTRLFLHVCVCNTAGEHHWLPPASLAVRAGSLEDVMQHGQLLVVDLDHVHNNPPSTSQHSATTLARDASASIAGQLDKCLRSCVDPARHTLLFLSGGDQAMSPRSHSHCASAAPGDLGAAIECSPLPAGVQRQVGRAQLLSAVAGSRVASVMVWRWASAVAGRDSRDQAANDATSSTVATDAAFEVVGLTASADEDCVKKVQLLLQYTGRRAAVAQL
ncbi:hypothetical protein HaLaN_24126 [Haematococcus lacustris]|uniref:Uncharacterized protein n=1 Tax=Haematococcus lacustris TaxID=44745 RepID=A0A6A0A2Z6_HAELA|nr:hypothetical protein HaLaN_24126 [Haematococcus lacustris]